jgi:hypothetical protein
MYMLRHFNGFHKIQGFVITDIKHARVKKTWFYVIQNTENINNWYSTNNIRANLNTEIEKFVAKIYASKYFLLYFWKLLMGIV